MENLLDPGITTHTFDDILLDSPVTFHIMKLQQNALFIYVGENNTFGNLAVAMKTPYAPKPMPSNLMGHSTDELSCSLAEKMAHHTGKQVFASCNLAKTDNCIIVALMQRLLKETKAHPEMF